MAINIPEILLYNLISGIVKHIKIDIENHIGTPETSFLGIILKDIKDHKHDYYVEAVDIFSRKEDHPRALRVRLFFDAKEANIPTIHITMPQENEGNNSLGAGESDINYIDELDKTISPERERRFDTTFNAIITSDNHREVLIIYHVIRAMLVSALSEINIAGLENPKLGGQDIRLQEDIIPRNIYMRGISIGCSYEVEVPRFFSSKMISQLIINPGTPIDPNKPDMGLQSQVTLDNNN